MFSKEEEDTKAIDEEISVEFIKTNGKKKILKK